MRPIWTSAAAGVVAAAGLSVFYRQSVVLPERQLGELRAQVTQLNREIDDARAAITQVRTMETEAASARTRLAAAEFGVPSTSPLLWVPDEMSRYFRRFGFEKVTTRLNTSAPEPELTGYQRSFWAVTLPLDTAGHAAQSLLAISELETAVPHVRVVATVISGDASMIGGRTTVLTISVLTRLF